MADTEIQYMIDSFKHMKENQVKTSEKMTQVSDKLTIAYNMLVELRSSRNLDTQLIGQASSSSTIYSPNRPSSRPLPEPPDFRFGPQSPYPSPVIHANTLSSAHNPYHPPPPPFQSQTISSAYNLHQLPLNYHTSYAFPYYTHPSFPVGYQHPWYNNSEIGSKSFYNSHQQTRPIIEPPDSTWKVPDFTCNDLIIGDVCSQIEKEKISARLLPEDDKKVLTHQVFEKMSDSKHKGDNADFGSTKDVEKLKIVTKLISEADNVNPHLLSSNEVEDKQSRADQDVVSTKKNEQEKEEAKKSDADSNKMNVEKTDAKISESLVLKSEEMMMIDPEIELEESKPKEEEMESIDLHKEDKTISGELDTLDDEKKEDDEIDTESWVYSKDEVKATKDCEETTHDGSSYDQRKQQLSRILDYEAKSEEYHKAEDKASIWNSLSYLILMQSEDDLVNKIEEAAKLEHVSMEVKHVVAELVCEKTKLLLWLLAKIKMREFEGIKRYVSEILVILLQNSTTKKRLGQMNGVDVVLEGMAMYKSKDPKTPDEEKLLENLFDYLCCLLMPLENKWEVLKLFREIQRQTKDRVTRVRYNVSGILLACQMAGKTIEIFQFLDEAAAKCSLCRTQKKTFKVGDESLTVNSEANAKIEQAATVSSHTGPDAKHIAVALLDSIVKVFYMDFHLSLYGHKLPVMCIDILSDGELTVIGSQDKNLKIWGMDFGDCHKSIFAHGDNVMGVKFVWNTHYLFNIGKDSLVKYWDVYKFQLLLTLEGHHAAIWCLAVNNSGDFHIDMHTFCTVLEYYSGKDLDVVLQMTSNLHEKEAMISIMQIVQGLVFLNKRSQKLIHYDLKPRNLLFDEFGETNVTDFGLSQIVEDNAGSQGMELTSQGVVSLDQLIAEMNGLNWRANHVLRFHSPRPPEDFTTNSLVILEDK